MIYEAEWQPSPNHQISQQMKWIFMVVLKLTDGGGVPHCNTMARNKVITILENTFGPQWLQVVWAWRSLPCYPMEPTHSIWNIARSVKTSDVAMMGGHHGWWWWWWLRKKKGLTVVDTQIKLWQTLMLNLGGGHGTQNVWRSGYCLLMVTWCSWKNALSFVHMICCGVKCLVLYLDNIFNNIMVFSMWNFSRIPWNPRWICANSIWNGVGIHDVYGITNWLGSQPTLIPWIPGGFHMD